MKLSGKVVLVTGAARRVGRAIAEVLGGAGAELVLHYHTTGPDEVRAAMQAVPGDTVFAHRADLRVADEARGLIEAVRARHGRLDVLVNSAATYTHAPFDAQDDTLWEDMLALNVIAPARLIRLGLALGLSAVVNVVDVGAWQPWRHHAAYAASKAALLQLTRCLALELAPRVRVNAVAPGVVAFPPGMDEAARTALRGQIPLGHEGEAADAAHAVRFLLEQEFLTGVALPVDGGASLR